MLSREWRSPGHLFSRIDFSLGHKIWRFWCSLSQCRSYFWARKVCVYYDSLRSNRPNQPFKSGSFLLRWRRHSMQAEKSRRQQLYTRFSLKKPSGSPPPPPPPVFWLDFCLIFIICVAFYTSFTCLSKFLQKTWLGRLPRSTHCVSGMASLKRQLKLQHA